MSLTAEFHRLLGEIVRLPESVALAILDTALEIANEELDKLTAERLILEGWEDDSKSTDQTD